MFHKILRLTKTFSNFFKLEQILQIKHRKILKIFLKNILQQKLKKKKKKKRNWHGIDLCLWLKHGILSIHLLTLYNTNGLFGSLKKEGGRVEGERVI